MMAWAVSIPLCFLFIAGIRGFIIESFRFSEDYRIVYSVGGVASFFLQMMLIILSLAMGIHIFIKRKSVRPWVAIMAICMGLSPFIYFILTMLTGSYGNWE